MQSPCVTRLLPIVLLCLFGVGLCQDKASEDTFIASLLGLAKRALPWRAPTLPPSCKTPYPRDSTMCKYWDSKDVVASGVSAAGKQTIVDEHNAFRTQASPAAANMAMMYWDDELAKIAQKWANTCPTSGHDTVVNRMVPGYGVPIGQNMAWGLKGWKAVVDSWHAEVSLYTYGSLKNYELIKQYTQLVRDMAMRVGCGYARCSSGSYYVCNYAKGKAPDAARPYESGSSCSRCPNKCQNKLCDCNGLLCKNGGVLVQDTCTCQCASGWSGSDCVQAGSVATPKPATPKPIQPVQVASSKCPDDIKDRSYCSRYPMSYCTTYRTWPDRCPIKCGVCKPEVAVSQPSSGGCAGKRCMHHGRLQGDCTCACTADWMGDSCQYMACGPDPSYCSFYKGYCKHRFISDACKKACGRC